MHSHKVAQRHKKHPFEMQILITLEKEKLRHTFSKGEVIGESKGHDKSMKGPSKMPILFR